MAQCTVDRVTRPWRRVVGWVLGTSFLCGAMLAAQAAQADVFTINDASDTSTISFSPTTSTRLFNLACGALTLSGEACIVDVRAPAAGDTIVQSGAGLGTLPLRMNVGIAGPGESLISDVVNAGPEAFVASNSTFGPCNAPCDSYHLVFTSDSETLSALGNTQTCSDIGGCLLTETGAVQSAGTINWADATGAVVATDTIEFQSDLEPGSGPPVPEPSSILLVLPGATGLYVMRRLRIIRPAA